MKRITKSYNILRLALIVVLVFVGTTVMAENMAFVYDDHGKRDPLWPLVNESGGMMSYDTDFTVSDLVLEGIMAGVEGTHVAIINGRIVKEGDQLGDFVIMEVQSESVKLKKDNVKFELKLKKED